MKLRSIIVLIACCLLTCSSKSQGKLPQNSGEQGLPSTKMSYDELKKEASERREAFRKAYNSAATKAERDSILSDAQNYLLDTADKFFSAWYGTPWTFHGHSQTPKQGSIACGYFITTTLRDMGFPIPRIKWAQQTSEYVIKKLSNDIMRFRQKPMSEVVAYIESKGEGLYIAGLDCHVGYIYYKDGKMSFVHANYYRPKIGVMSEPLVGRNPLNDSKYRVIGKIFDKEMTLHWIMNTAYTE